MNRLGPRVLIVEDDESLGFVVAKFFHALGWQTASASNAPDALGGLSSAPDLVVLDLMMPGPGDGIAVLKEIRSRGVAVPVVIHTGCDNAEALAEVRSMNPERLYRKPIDWTEFQEYIAGRFAAFRDSKKNS